jgi:hypothetical protein
LHKKITLCQATLTEAEERVTNCPAKRVDWWTRRIDAYYERIDELEKEIALLRNKN